MSKCLNCIHYDDKHDNCENGHDKDCCPFFKDVNRCQSNCEFCEEKTTCELHESDIKNKEGYKEYFKRYIYD